jgi:hypothetical protein
MDRLAPTSPPPELQVRAPQLEPGEGPAAQAAKQRLVEHAAALSEDPSPTLSVRLDENAGRFVTTLTDPLTNEMLRSYPSEAQLAYSRAVMAYLRAMSGAQS